MERIPKFAFTNKSDEQALDEGCYFDRAKAQKILDFVKILNHPSGKLAGQPFKLLRYQKIWLMNLFGWQNKDHTRRYKYSYIFIPRGSGKSTLLAIVVWYITLCDDEPSPSCEIGAVDRFQASRIYNYAYELAVNSPQLFEYLEELKIRTRNNQKEIILPKINGMIRAMSKESKKALGGNNNLLVFDEICAYSTRELFNNMIDSINKDRKQKLCLMLTTAGSDMSLNNIGYEKYQYAKSVLDGSIIDTTFYPLIFEAPQQATDEELAKESTWLTANPSLNTHVLSLDDFRNEYETAKTSAADWLRFKRYRLNVFTATSTTSYIPVEVWKNNVGDTTIPPKANVWLALDLSSINDLTALSLICPVNDKYIIKNWAWIPLGFKERQKQNTLLYQSFAHRNELVITPTERRDDLPIENKILELAQLYNIQKITFDAWQCHELANRLVQSGFDCNEMPQTVKEFNEPTKLLERLAYKRKLIVDDSEMIKWQLQNVAIEVSRDGKFIKPRKQSPDSPQKIDNIISMIMALSECAITKEQSGGEVFVF